MKKWRSWDCWHCASASRWRWDSRWDHRRSWSSTTAPQLFEFSQREKERGES